MVRHGSAKPSFVGSNPITALVPIEYRLGRCGGIGRRAGLKILCPHGRVGSTPTIGIGLTTKFEAASHLIEELFFWGATLNQISKSRLFYDILYQYQNLKGWIRMKKVFYGWWIVIAAMLVFAVITPASDGR